MLKEVPASGSNSIDLLGVDIEGNIYIIETKLASNTEIRRIVVGQVLDYASSLWQKDFGWLNDVVKRQKGVDIYEYFKVLNNQEWIKDFERKICNKLEQGSFILIIAVDAINQELKRIIEYMGEVLNIKIYALEIQSYEGSDAQILTLNLYGDISQQPNQKQKWDWEKFREQAKKYLDPETFLTVEKLYDFAQKLLDVDFGEGNVYATFRVNIPYKTGGLTLFNIASIENQYTYFNFKGIATQGVGENLIREYIGKLNTLGFNLDDEESIKQYPAFKVSLLNEPEKFEKFKQYTLEFAEKIRSTT
ncbi:MAG: hypothetical protein QW429_03460 [Thermoprotei archaeon]